MPLKEEKTQDLIILTGRKPEQVKGFPRFINLFKNAE